MEDDSARIEKIYQEDPKLKKEDVDKISHWAETQPHLPQIKELQVILFLHSCHYEIKTAQKTIENYFTVKSSSYLFESADEDLIRRTLTSCFIGFMPKRTPDNYAVLLTKMLDTKPEKYIPDEQVKVFFMTFLLYCHQYGPIDGLVGVSDMDGISMAHVFKMNLSAAKTMSYFMQEAAPVRITGMHYLNANAISRYAFKFVKPFIKRELYESIKFHSHDYHQNLYEQVPKECLPKEYGGDLGPLQELQEANLENLLSHMDFFKWHDNQKVDETKREPKKGTGFFGFFKN